LNHLKSGGNNALIELEFDNYSPEYECPNYDVAQVTFPSLKTLKFNGGDFRVDGIIEMIHRCPELTEFKASRISKPTTLLGSLLERSNKITHLFLPDCRCDEDELLNLLTSSLGQRLLSLDVSSLGKRLSSDEISQGIVSQYSYDRVIAAISTSCRELRYLDIRWNRCSDDELILIARGCRHLKHLNLKNCKGVSDASFKDLCSLGCEQLLNQLEHLDVGCCDLYSSIPSFCTLFPQLKRLDITGIQVDYDVVDEFLGQHSSANPSGFIELRMTDFDRFTREEFVELKSYYPNANLIY